MNPNVSFVLIAGWAIAIGHLEKLLDSPKSATENPEISFAMYSDFELIEVPY
jgi:hypothetical protein